MPFTNLTTNLNAHQSLPENPNQANGLTYQQLQAAWDKPVNDVKTYINDTLISELEDSTASSKLGAVVAGLESNVQAFIDYVELAGTGNVPPNNTITNAMLVSDIKIGSLVTLNTTIKTSLVAAINELKSIITNDNTPAGVIRMWSGLISAIPSGNVICDGTNGTPDLRNKFIMGAQDQTEMNSTGGSNTKTLTNNELPGHTHNGSTSTSGEHNHTIQLRESGGSGALLHTEAANTPNTEKGTSYAGSHSHTFTTSSTGSGQAFDIRPAYYALAFIMKV